jgi:hypothetical protein
MMSRPVPCRPDRIIVVLLLSLLAAPAALQAQAAPGDTMAFPRQVLTWYLAGDADRVWPLAGETLRELAESPRRMKEDAAEIIESMGPRTGVISEQMFAHPEGGGWQVYVQALRHERAPEMFWIVIFSPAKEQVQMIMAQPRQTVRTLFPQVKLP